MWGLSPSLLGKNLCNYDYPPFCGLPTGGWGLSLYCISASPTHLPVVPSLYLKLWKIASASLQVIIINSCSVNSCNFGVPVGGGEVKGTSIPPFWPQLLQLGLLNEVSLECNTTGIW